MFDDMYAEEFSTGEKLKIATLVDFHSAGNVNEDGILHIIAGLSFAEVGDLAALSLRNNHHWSPSFQEAHKKRSPGEAWRI